MAEAALMEEYYVSEACIACDACCNDFPDVFTMDAAHTRASAFAPTAKGKYNPWDIVLVCPVDAISLIKGEMPPPPEGLKEEEAEAVVQEDTRPWQERWAEVADLVENPWERMKRYGMAYEVDEDLEKYTIRVALPAEIPNHTLKFQWGLPNKMPDYKITVSLEGQHLRIQAKLEDKRIIKLCSAVNSFPDRFVREFDFPVACKDEQHTYSAADKVLEVVVHKGVAAQAA